MFDLLPVNPALPATHEEVERFLGYVEVLNNGCWFWRGARSRGSGNSKWHGSFRYRGTTIRAHRFSHDALKGLPCPPGHHRDHECSFSLCVNPEHIFCTTHAENQRFKVERGQLCSKTALADYLERKNAWLVE